MERYRKKWGAVVFKGFFIFVDIEIEVIVEGKVKNQVGKDQNNINLECQMEVIKWSVELELVVISGVSLRKFGLKVESMFFVSFLQNLIYSLIYFFQRGRLKYECGLVQFEEIGVE